MQRVLTRKDKAGCSHVIALEPGDCLRANKKTQLTALISRALRAIQQDNFQCPPMVVFKPWMGMNDRGGDGKRDCAAVQS